jgi:hypothetical protein
MLETTSAMCPIDTLLSIDCRIMRLIEDARKAAEQ